jgi:hypothetical protein
MEDGRRYLKALGARILAEANDLKRTPDSLARELGLDAGLVRRVIVGEADRAAAEALALAMSRTYPISLADVWVDHDDTDGGVRVMDAEVSKATTRIFERKTREGREGPYYEYRDTAMSATAPYKPERIMPLRIVSDTRPDNPDVAYNHGHLLHQTTFFIGEVNFYWQVNGETHCRAMNTGDSNYITPFVPHSFTSRNPDRPGLIIAITYGAGVRRAMNEVSLVGGLALSEIAGDLRDPAAAFAARLRYLRDAESLSARALALRLAESGIARGRAEAIADGTAEPADGERVLLARCLGVRVNEIAQTPIVRGQEVAIRPSEASISRPFPDSNNACYVLKELVRTPHQPLLKGFELTVRAGASGETAFRHGLHTYVYNYGVAPVELIWTDGRSKMLMPGASAYIRPTVTHGFRAPDGTATLVMARITGGLTCAVLDEFATFPESGRARAAHEVTRWY